MKTGWERRKERVAAGLPRYGVVEAASRKRRDLRRAALRREKFYDKIGRIKQEQGCTDCGFNAHPFAMHFDHLPEFEKSAGIASLWWAPWARVVAEMAKCEVVCANCHAIRTITRRENSRIV